MDAPYGIADGCQSGQRANLASGDFKCLLVFKGLSGLEAALVVCANGRDDLLRKHVAEILKGLALNVRRLETQHAFAGGIEARKTKLSGRINIDDKDAVPDSFIDTLKKIPLLAQLRFGISDRRDVPHGSEHLDGALSGIKERVAGEFQNAGFSVRQANTQLAVERRMRAQRFLDVLTKRPTFPGIDAAKTCLDGGGEGLWSESQDAIHLVGPGDRVRRNIPVPAPCMADALGVG